MRHTRVIITYHDTLNFSPASADRRVLKRRCNGILNNDIFSPISKYLERKNIEIGKFSLGVEGERRKKGGVGGVADLSDFAVCFETRKFSVWRGFSKTFQMYGFQIRNLNDFAYFA